jgi:starvation-inducible DNA-binding protein
MPKRNNNVTEAASPVQYETLNDLPKTSREQIINLLNQRLADAIDLQSQVKQAHWNVKGPHFIGLHKLFDEIYDAVSDYVDLIAERAVQLGGVAHGTVRVAAESSRLDQYPPDISTGQAHVVALSRALAEFGRGARMGIDEADGFDDADTADILTEISRGTDQWLWFVEAHLQADA